MYVSKVLCTSDSFGSLLKCISAWKLHPIVIRTDTHVENSCVCRLPKDTTSVFVPRFLCLFWTHFSKGLFLPVLTEFRHHVWLLVRLFHPSQLFVFHANAYKRLVLKWFVEKLISGQIINNRQLFWQRFLFLRFYIDSCFSNVRVCMFYLLRVFGHFMI